MMETKLTPAEIAEMYKNRPAPEIHENTGLTLWEIYSTLHAAGVEMMPRGRRPVLVSPGIETLQCLLDEGNTQKEVGQMFGVSKRTVQRWLKPKSSIKKP